jgi:hypothetical protein
MEITKLDYYAALEVPPSASAAEIERAYQFALESYGPDSLAAYGILSDAEREEVVKFLNEAHTVLCNAELRRAYNRKLETDGKYPAEQLQTWAASVVPPPEERVPQPVSETPAPPPPVQQPLRPAAPAPQASAPVIPASPANPPPKPVQPAPAAAPALETPPPQAKERSWWPFGEKERPAEPVTQAAAPVPAPAPAPLPKQDAPINIPALDGRPIGGPELREIREARGLRLEDISTQTKISLSNLRFLEEANYKFLPAPVYVKGFLRTYARILRVDAEKVIQDYMAAFEAHRQA